MKKSRGIGAIALLSTMFFVAGCLDPGTLLAAASAGLKTYEAGVQQGSDEYVLSDKMYDELQSLYILYEDAEAATAAAKPGLESKIAAASQAMVADGQTLLNLAAIKNPTKREIAGAAIAAVEVFISFVQSKHPDPSGNVLRLNSTAAQLKAAAKSGGK